MAGRTKKATTSITRRREAVADAYIQGRTQAAIARDLGISQPTVSTDLKAIQTQWRESAIRDFDLLRERELQKLDRVEREAWEAWERSQKPSQQSVVSTSGDGQRTQNTVKDQSGDPRFLEAVHKCIAGRRALLGLDAPTRIAPTSPDGEQAYHARVMSELMRLAEQSKNGPEVIDAAYISSFVSQENSEHATDKNNSQGNEKNE